jgi:hypothetical protein
VLPCGTDVPSSKVGLAFCIVDLVVNVSDVTLSTPARVCVLQQFLTVLVI